MSNAQITISRRGVRTHASIRVRDNRDSSTVAITNNKEQTRMTLHSRAHGEAAAEPTAAADANA